MGKKHEELDDQLSLKINIEFSTEASSRSRRS